MSQKLASYFILFTLIILTILWLCETVFLEQIYSVYKTVSVHSQINTVSEHIGSFNFEKDIVAFGEKYASTIIITDTRGTTLAQSNQINHSYIDILSSEHIKDLYDQTVLNNNEKTFYKNYDATDKIVSTKVVTIGQNTYFILIESELAPVAATVEALKVELVIITVLVMIIAIIMVLFISKRLATPITKTTETASKLAAGKFPKEFNNGGYREIEELNKTLEYASNELERIDRLSNELIANISHDLRTPLTMIGGYAEAMRDIPGESSAENLQIIIDESDRLKNLVNQLLFLSKLKSGSNKLKRSIFNITEVTKNIVARINKMVEQDGFQVIFANIENVDVFADKERIQQVIYNLIANAIAYTGEDRKVMVRQTVLKDGVKIEVIDSGKGIEQDMLPYVWKRYYKNPYAKSQYKGVGVGLSIVKGILDLHEADYGIQSEVGKGSNFWFIIKDE